MNSLKTINKITASNIAYTRPPGAVGAECSELYTISVHIGYFSAGNTGSQVYANR